MQALWSVIVTRLETQKQNNNILVLSGHQDVEPKSQKVIGFSHLSQPCVFISGQNTYQCQTQDWKKDFKTPVQKFNIVNYKSKHNQNGVNYKLLRTLVWLIKLEMDILNNILREYFSLTSITSEQCNKICFRVSNSLHGTWRDGGSPFNKTEGDLNEWLMCKLSLVQHKRVVVLLSTKQGETWMSGWCVNLAPSLLLD